MNHKIYPSFLGLLLFSLVTYGQYCLPTYGNQCTSGDFIDSFTFSTISNTSTGCSGPSASNYTNYSSTIATTVVQGGSYIATASPGPTWGQFFGMWIDFNNDTDFVDAGEYFPLGYAAGGGSVSASITIPAATPVGSYRMRILCRFGTAALSQPDVCSATLNYGEVEDYTLNVIAQPALDAGLVQISSPISGCGLTGNEIVTVAISNTGADTLFSTPVCFSLNNGTPVCETVTDTILPSDTITYSFSTGANASTAGSYILDAWTSLVGDSTSFNDSTLGYVFDNIPQLSNLPYTEGFENGNGGWIPSGTNSTWAVGPPVNTFINAAANGSNAYVTNLTGFYNNNESSFLTSPCFDFSGLGNDPKLRFSHIFQSETNFDDSWVEVSTNGGTSWTKLNNPGLATNWYNDTINQVWEGTSGTAGIWRIAEHPLTGTAGSGSVRIRFGFNSDGSVQQEGFGVDNIAIYDTLIDVSVSALIRPVNSCGMSGTDTVEIELKNLGTISVSNVPVCYTVNAGAPVCETIPGTIAPGATVNHIFSGTANLSAVGTYAILAYSSLSSDSSNDNDTLATNVENIPVINTFPYTEGFENGPAGWSSEGTNNTWALGVPAGTIIPAAASGTEAWVTNLSGDYNNSELSFLVSPCFDFTGLTLDPKLRFSHIFATEACCDEGWVDFSIDGGNTWSKLMGGPQAVNWYNDTLNDWWDGSSGTPGTWRIAEAPLTGFAGQGDVKFRWVFQSDGSVTAEGFGVDNVSIFDTLIDVAMVSIDGPASSCGMGTDTISVTLSNLGTLNMSSIPICYTVNGGTPVCETIPGPLAAGASMQHAFATPFNFATPGQYDIVAYVSVAGDSAADNDTTTGTIIHINTINTFPYSEDFENGQGDWVSGGTGSTWAFGTPAKTNINTASSGVNAWVNGGLSGSYNNNEASFVIGPCFDFSTLVNPWVRLDIWRASEFSWDGAILQGSIDDGATWTTIGANGDPYNWYNDSTIAGLNNFVGSGHGWTGSGASGSTAWELAKHDLSGFAGQSSVRLRIAFGSDGVINDEGIAFDNFVVAELPALDFGPDTVICDTSYVLDPGFTTGEFAWSTGDTTATLTVDTSGMYGLVYTDSNGLCVEDSVMLTLSPQAPVVAIGNDTTICTGAQLCLDAGAGTGWTYSWSNGAATQTSCFSGSSTISVTVADQVGCTASDSLSLTSVDPPAISFTSDTSGCPTVSFVSSSTGGPVNSYNWNFGDGNGSGAPNPVNTYATDSTYNVILIATNGCSSDTFIAPVVVNCLMAGLDDQLTVNLEVFPNPTSSEVFLRFGNSYRQEVSVRLLDLSGKTLRNWELGNIISGEARRLQLTSVSSGIYFLQVKAAGKTSLAKLVIE